MLNAKRLHSLSKLPAPVLTVYLNIASVEASQHTPVRRYLIWLRAEAKSLVERVPASERELFWEQLHRVEEFLRDRVPQGRGLVVFAGLATWETVSLQTEIGNELHWGKPAVSRLQWLAAEHGPYCIVAVDRGGARFFSYSLGEMVPLRETVFVVDISQWKKKDLGHVSRPGIRKTRGSQRDVFEHRMDAQYEHVCRETAEQANHLRKKEHFATIFLVGSVRLIEPIEKEFPEEDRQRVVLILKDLGKLAPHELQQHVEPEIEKWERERESALVNELLGSERGVVVGIDETLAQLQDGKLRRLVLASNFDADLRQCLRCRWADRSADPVCSVCRGERRPITLRDALPDLVLRSETDVVVVSGEAAKRLEDAGGIGAWLGQQKQSRLLRAAARAR